jgi:hypothetical protein
MINLVNCRKEPLHRGMDEKMGLSKINYWAAQKCVGISEV